jgi:hypothetical protein
MGVGSGFMWAPIGTAATRNLPMDRAGAGAGVYNTTRQVGAVLGSAGIAALMQARLVGGPARRRLGRPGGRGGDAARPALHPAFSTAMAQSLLLPAGAAADRDRGRVRVRPAAPPGSGPRARAPPPR